MNPKPTRTVLLTLVLTIIFCGLAGHDALAKKPTPTPTPEPTPTPPPGLTNPAYAFVATEIGGQANQVWIATADASASLQLTTTGLGHYYPTWSPDGQRIAYVTEGDLYVMNADGTDQGLLCQTGDFYFDYFSRTWEYRLDWSPDASHIVFTAADPVYEERNVWVARLGADPPSTCSFTPLTHVVFGGGEYVSGAAWSPDLDPTTPELETQIAYHLRRESAGWIGDLMLMDVTIDTDGQLTVGATVNRTETPDLNEYAPDFSSDGTWIVYTASAPGDAGRSIHKILRQGVSPGELILPSVDPTYDFPRFSSDDLYIALSQWRTDTKCRGVKRDVEIWRMFDDGSGLTNVTESPCLWEGLGGLDWNPAWENDL